MPYVRLSLLRGKSDEYLKNVSDAIYDALVESYEMAENDRFQIINQLEPNELIFDRNYFGGPRSDDFMVMTITAGKDRTIAVKKAFYKRVVALLHERAGVRPEDVFIMLETNPLENFSFSSGMSLIPD
ncbi:tautomerase family protein [Rhizobium deserti]|uniref:Tautomerase family protein n=1 Tax=Rhizobium deserti TaxID=2547961 RepID=A0A4R5U719_9HYPH|nr:tautomerase family protein [Rhizobium deserti]TDK29843.1 tautomerase family protein [Rhizobium deserti]